MTLQTKKTDVTKKLRHCYAFPMASLTVDGVVFGFDPADELNPLKVLMIRRGEDPFSGLWAFPGGHVNIDKFEYLEDAVRREVQEETRAKLEYLEQLYTFADPHRDPRGRVVSVAYFALVRKDDHEDIEGGDDADRAEWIPIQKLLKMKLAFDHDQILLMALKRLRAKVRYAPIGFELLPKTFTIRQIQQLYEAILQRKLDKSTFRYRITLMGILSEVGEVQPRVGPPAKLYRFDKKAYEKAVEQGLNFEV
jgi:8-oxo-dGTP diphosphatase